MASSQAVITERDRAPCKQVRVYGDDVDILQYPWLKCNPADGGRYINCGAVITEDPEFGRNIGTYRCQVKDKTKIGVNPEPSKDGWRQLMAARDRGEKVMKAAVVLGADPITWAMSCAKIARLGEDEYELAGGLRGKPVEVVKCETSDILVPANAEMIIEGEIPLDQEEEEGPHAEMFGYLGHKRDTNFFMNVKAVTHRHDPLFINVHTGVTRGFHTAPLEASALLKYKKSIPNIVAFHSLDGAMGIMVVSIKKRVAGDGLAVGQQVAATNRVAKVTIVVDDDVDVLNTRQVMHAVGSRWQPHPATLVIPHAWGSVIDPSAAKPGVISKIVIDATRQYPDEGGPASWPPVSRSYLKRGALKLSISSTRIGRTTGRRSENERRARVPTYRLLFGSSLPVLFCRQNGNGVERPAFRCAPRRTGDGVSHFVFIAVYLVAVDAPAIDSNSLMRSR